MYIKTDKFNKNYIEEILKKINVEYLIFEDKDCIKFAILSIINDEELKEILKNNKCEMVKLEAKYKYVSREFKKTDTVVEIKGHKIGNGNIILMAGPCSVENKEMLSKIAKKVSEFGAIALRGGAYKPRTSPYDFQGLGEKGLIYLKEVAEENNMLVVTEAMDTENLDLVSKYADIIQIGARNMQNFSLLKKLGNIGKPVLLKRGFSSTITEFLMAAEYIMSYGNPDIILCERGIRTFETMTRNTLDLNAIALIKKLSHLPIIIDASHGTGLRELVEPLTLSGIIAGADGAMIEVHENPSCALSDARQTIDFESFERLSKKFFKTVEFKKELDTL